MCDSMMIHTAVVTCVGISVDEKENGENVFLLETQGMNLGQTVASVEEMERSVWPCPYRCKVRQILSDFAKTIKYLTVH